MWLMNYAAGKERADDIMGRIRQGEFSPVFLSAETGTAKLLEFVERPQSRTAPDV